MLARVNAGAGGVVSYLETGRKQGREYERDLIDERIALEGNLDVLEATIDAIETRQEGDTKYLHITLGFAEEFTAAEVCRPGQINAALMADVTAAYRDALMAAYDPSEYVFYAEAHVPKVTHELNWRTGEYEVRLPHVHIVIPKRNIETDRFMDPFGYMPEPGYAQAIQEEINRRFGLRSPQDARRDLTTAGPAANHPLGKHEPTFEGMSPKQMREYVAQLVERGTVRNFEQLVEHAGQLGAVSVRAGTEGAYLNIKPEWADRGVNFKAFTREGFADQAEALRADRAAPRAVDYSEQVTDWRERGAFEARYVATQRLKRAYKGMTEPERAAFLNERRAQTAERLHARAAPPATEPATAMARAGRGEPAAAARGLQPEADPHLSMVQPRVRTGAQLKAEADPRAVLALASERYGIDPTDYETGIGRDGSPRVVHAGRHYNLGDFFTKHLQRPWGEARAALVRCQSDSPERVSTGEPNERPDYERIDGDSADAKRLQRFAALHQSRHREARRRRAPESLAGVRNLSSLTLVRDRPDAAVLLQPHASDRVGTQGVAGAEVRRPRTGLDRVSAADRAGGIGEVGRDRIGRNAVTVAAGLRLRATPRASDPEALKADTNPLIVLAEAQRRYGIQPDDYSVGAGRDGTPRIIHAGKQYNLGDFFTKHLGRPWVEAEQVLRQCCDATYSDALPPPGRDFWRQFTAWREAQGRDASEDRADAAKRLRDRMLASRASYQAAKEVNQRLAPGKRAVAQAQARADLFIAQAQIAADRKQSREALRVPTRNAHYRQFLNELASAGDAAALAELRRMAPVEPAEADRLTGERSRAGFPLPSYSVDRRGAVIYQLDGRAAVRDAQYGVTVLDVSAAAYDAALKVAVTRFGRDVTLHGGEDFIAGMTAAARRSGLPLTLRNGAHPQARPIEVRARGEPER